jgi:hypothetical protein
LIHQLERVFDEVLTMSEYEQRLAEVTAFNNCYRYVKRGLAIVPTKFGISFENRFMNQVCLSCVTLLDDRRVLLFMCIRTAPFLSLMVAWKWDKVFIPRLCKLPAVPWASQHRMSIIY